MLQVTIQQDDDHISLSSDSSSDDEDFIQNRAQKFISQVSSKPSLSATDRYELRNNVFLSDTIINMTQFGLKYRHDAAHGLQDTILGIRLQYSHSVGEFVQILHNGGYHWLAVTTVGCRPGEIVLMDSLLHKNGGKFHIYKQVVDQVCNMMALATKTLTIRVEDVQQQSNGFDCGIFAIAFCKFILEYHR